MAQPHLGPRVASTVRIPAHLHAAAARRAASRRVTMNALVCEALERMLEGQIIPSNPYRSNLTVPDENGVREPV